MDVVPTYL